MRDTLLKSSSSESEKSILRNMSLVWDLKSKWESNIYDLLKNMKTIPIKSMAFKKDHDLIEEDIFIFLLISLYVVIPNQMGMLYIIKNGIKMRKNFNKDKKSLLKYLEKTLSIGSEWKKLISRYE